MKSPFRSISVAGYLTAIGAYALSHLSPDLTHSDLGTIIVGVSGVVAGVLQHHTGETP
jgi:hypothetical protein